ncbi:unnamed protein product [Candidula unifasciata]|uniref:Uncharacterized protein n=1 Tax=Candidula unifasciata TaxID=100452 RepID=A0A8S3ZEV7_9EUPU|nr:unnamed protein product [Candidula unifasciata]
MAKLTGFVYMLLLLAAQPLVAQCQLLEIAGAVGGAAIVAVGAPVILGAAGFGAGGIAAGSLGAKLMSAAYTAKLGVGVVSALQSAGAAGLGVFSYFAGAAAGAGAGHYAGSYAGGNKDERGKC